MPETIDKSTELNATLTLLNDRLHFSGVTGTNDTVSIDYTPPLGDNLGYTSLELLLLSLGSCMGSSTLTLLRRMKREIKGFAMNIRGIRRNEHPTGFKTIFIEIYLRSANVTDTDMEHALKLSEDTYCPVWAMVKGNVEVKVTSIIQQ